MDSHYWSDWSGKFQRGHLTPVILALLDGVGPLRSVLAQGMLAFSPFIATQGHSSWVAFAEMMEDPGASRAFSDFLRQEGS